ncbi:hypothetical protein RhiirA4_495361 [Rhizophagus irregularis]|uniref:Protein kinase domain-containing protein n=1 Tax=Rhizophagus irregularis TaxID=588596 RepID=A0A2I1GZB4_9GLOM|nr:hypothetical protein RhiirA4_495361 [Rhizophagus irregularis]
MTSSSYINENYLDYSEFQPINEINNEKISVVRKAKWIKHDIKVALKGLIPNEFIQEIRQFCKVRCHLNPNINKILGTTKGPFDNDIVVLEYANEGNLREYLYDQFMTLNWRKKMEMALDITRGLMCLHSENIIHRNLHSRNILVNDDKLKIADFAYSTQLFEDMPMSKVPMIEYTDPKYLFDPLNCKLDFKSDIYSLSILLWELSSGYPAYSKFQQSDQLRYDIINGLREETVGNTPVKYQWLYQKCWEQDPDQRLNISEVLEILDQLTEVNIDDPVVQNDDQEIIQNLKLNYGLFLYGYGMQHSKYAIYDDIGELEISLYDGQPLVYTNINDKPYDACINFPFAEITYKGNLLDTFLNYDDMDGKLNNFYGHFYSDKVLVGGQLFIKDFNTTQIQFLKMHISWAYNLVKSEENRSYNFINLQIEPRVETWDGKEIKTTEKLINWMNKIYQENVIDVIAYINPLRVSDLKGSKANVQPTSDSRDFNEIIIKVSNYKDRLNLDEWVKDSMYVNLPDDFNLFNLFQGLIIDKNLEMEIAKEVVIDLIKYPCLESKDNYNLKFEKPTNKLEEFLTSNNIFSIKKKINSPIFNNQFIMNNDELNYHFIINYEQYEILLPWNHLLLSKKFEEKLENAIKMMSPLKNLLNLFDEYGHLFPQKVILGKSFKYITTKNNPKFEGYPKMSTIESLKLYLKNLEIPYLSTQKGEIKIEDLSDFIQENEYLEIIEYDNVITLYDMLQRKQQYQVDHIFDYKIIMVGLYSLEDLNDDNTDIEHYVRISINTPLEDQDYEVFGSIISNKPTLRKPAIKFRSCDFKGFTAIINNLETQNLDFKITECYVLWMIVGKPSKLSIFSFDNQDFQVIRISESILLQPDKSYYEIKTPFRLSQGCMISINTYHPPINNEPTNLIEFVKWSYNSIIFHSNSILEALNINENEVGIEDEDNLLIENLSIELHICILFSNSKKLKVDNEIFFLMKRGSHLMKIKK